MLWIPFILLIGRVKWCLLLKIFVFHPPPSGHHLWAQAAYWVAPPEPRSYTTWANTECLCLTTRFFLSIFSVTISNPHILSSSLSHSYHFFCFSLLFIPHWTSRVSVCLNCSAHCLLLFSIGIYYELKRGRWSLSRTTIIYLVTCSNKWSGLSCGSVDSTQHTLCDYIYLKKHKHCKSNKGSLDTSLTCFISQK